MNNEVAYMQPHYSGVGKKIRLAIGMELVFKELGYKIATGGCNASALKAEANSNPN